MQMTLASIRKEDQNKTLIQFISVLRYKTFIVKLGTT